MSVGQGPIGIFVKFPITEASRFRLSCLASNLIHHVRTIGPSLKKKDLNVTRVHEIITDVSQ